jgi:hypothetical protein
MNKKHKVQISDKKLIEFLEEIISSDLNYVKGNIPNNHNKLTFVNNPSKKRTNPPQTSTKKQQQAHTSWFGTYLMGSFGLAFVSEGKEIKENIVSKNTNAEIEQTFNEVYDEDLLSKKLSELNGLLADVQNRVTKEDFTDILKLSLIYIQNNFKESLLNEQNS